MQLALYEPGLGYYSAGARKFGAAGDFVTAPEVAPVFRRCLAVQCAEVLPQLGPAAVILELGAGSGAMAAELLAELERRATLPSQYWILDVSADLRARQHEALQRDVPHLVDRVRWLDRLPEAFEGVIVANELLDALPVERFAIEKGEVAALGVSEQGGVLHTVEADLGAPLADGYESEACLGLGPWLESLAAPLRRGVALFVDYGLPRRDYYSPERTRGTLLCHFRHRFHERALERPGLQDITAWVDFTAVAEGAVAAGLDVSGYTTQAHFLIGCGIAEFVADVGDIGLAERLTLSRQAMLLTLPGEMGERFKVVALARGFDASLRGFAVRDLRHTL
jgi:SAM-dependent MidA family methyltransferase